MAITVDDADEGIADSKSATTTATDAATADAKGGDDGTPAYVVVLSDQSNVLRQGAYWDVKMPFKTLP